MVSSRVHRLGLVTASAKGTFDSTDSAVRNSAVNTVMLDRDLARYGPETAPIRDLIRRAVGLRDVRVDGLVRELRAPSS